MKASLNNFDGFKGLEVGDIVIIDVKGRDDTNRKKGFIEEVVVQPTPKNRIPSGVDPNHRFYSGTYSVFGLEKRQDDDWYFGDYRGADLKPLGKKMTQHDLSDYKKVLLLSNKNKGFVQDIEKVEAIIRGDIIA